MAKIDVMSRVLRYQRVLAIYYSRPAPVSYFRRPFLKSQSAERNRSQMSLSTYLSIVRLVGEFSSETRDRNPYFYKSAERLTFAFNSLFRARGFNRIIRLSLLLIFEIMGDNFQNFEITKYKKNPEFSIKIVFFFRNFKRKTSVNNVFGTLKIAVDEKVRKSSPI